MWVVNGHSSCLWEERYKQADLPANLVYSDDFFVGHLFIPKTSDVTAIQREIRTLFTDTKAEILLEVEDQVYSEHLGPNGINDEPLFWQVTGTWKDEQSTSTIGQILFDLQIIIEEKFPVHVASLSSHSCVYKVMGAANILPKYFEDLGNPLFQSGMTIGHNRYSTNTLSSFFRVQPFSLLGH